MSKTIRLLDTSILVDKPVWVSIRAIYGIGHTRALLILNHLQWSPQKRIKDLTAVERFDLVRTIQNFKKLHGWLLDRDLKRFIEHNIRTQVSLGTYRGIRHTLNLPVRGQRTHSNAKTQRRLKLYQSFQMK